MNCVDMGWRRMPHPAPIAVSDLSSSPSRKPSRKSKSDFPLTLRKGSQIAQPNRKCSMLGCRQQVSFFHYRFLLRQANSRLLDMSGQDRDFWDV